MIRNAHLAKTTEGRQRRDAKWRQREQNSATGPFVKNQSFKKQSRMRQRRQNSARKQDSKMQSC